MTKKMTQEMFDSWITALRSGEWPQTKEVMCLVDTDGTELGYCCLGVLLEQNDMLKGSVGLLSSDYSLIDAHGRRGKVTGPVSVRPPVRSLVNRYATDPMLDRETLHSMGFGRAVLTALATANDGGATFNDIANWLERVGLEGIKKDSLVKNHIGSTDAARIWPAYNER